MLNITDNRTEQTIPAILRLGFRPLFLSAAIFAVMAIAAWSMTLTGYYEFTPFNHAMWWHGHEMIFAFSCAVIVGFLLTAVTNWTGQPGVKGTNLFILWMIWILARVLLFANVSFISPVVVMAIDLLFLPVAAVLLAIPVLRVKQHRNLFFVPVLLLLAVCNFLSYQQSVGLTHGGYAALMLVTLVMVVMGGRVIPFFTANATNIPKREKYAIIEWLSIVSVVVLSLSFIFKLHTQEPFFLFVGLTCFIGAVANLIRLCQWRFTTTLATPLLWSLHLSYAFIPVTLYLMASHYLLGMFNLATVMHGLTIGAAGNMILAMMARVSLGHTGRPLILKKWMPSAFIMVFLAAIVRLAGILIDSQFYVYTAAISGLFWVAGFAIFSVIYWPILTRPRADGRPG
jgi:uncharacterized protein involved in response to NO